jgi:hypothetical protein
MANQSIGHLPGHMALVSGIHHVAVGVRDLASARQFYGPVLSFDEVLADSSASQRALAGLVRSTCLVYDSATLQQRNGGVMLELVERKQPAARPILSNFALGDIGLNGLVVVASDVPQTLRP